MPATFATCDLCDAHKNDTSGDFRVLPPVFRDFGAVKKFAGPVVTVKPRLFARRCMRRLPSIVSPHNSPMPQLWP